jgi:hypothetical protein
MKGRKITIEPVLNGYMVQVGCQTLAFHDRGKLVCELDRYLESPAKVEVEYLGKFGPVSAAAVLAQPIPTAAEANSCDCNTAPPPSVAYPRP